jgi:TPP-dependent pyruvate/acetoin dehydrogenase alpha subunit
MALKRWICFGEAAGRRIPTVLFVCENNLYAMERRLDTPFSDPNWKKGAAYGIEAEAVDGMNLMAVIDAADTAVQKKKYWKTLFIGLQYLSF